MFGSRKNILLIVMMSIGLLATVISTSAYAWLFVKVRETISQVALASEEAQLLAIKNAHTQTVRRVVRDTKEQRAELDTYFITEERIVEFLGDIEELGAHTGAPIDVQSVSAGAPVDKDGLVTPLRLSLKSEGTMQEVFYTLALLEAFPKVLQIEGARLTQHPTDLVWTGVFDVVVIEIDEIVKE